MKSDKLKGKLRERNLSYEQCAKCLEITTNAFYNKINKISNFTLPEAEKLGNLLQMTNEEKLDIFLS